MDNKIIGSIILEGAITAEDSIIIDNKSSNRVVAQGTLQDVDVENRNRRIYAKKDLFPEINGPRMKELIKAQSFKGEAGHPMSEDLVRQQTIDPKLVCVNFLKIWTERNKVKAIFKGTNNDLGKEFDQDLRDGEKPAFSLRALGGIENVNGKAYVRNIKIITYDRVYFPSHSCAYTEGLLTESAMMNKSMMSVKDKYIKENQIYVPENDPGRIITLRESDAKDIINRLQRESANLTKMVETFDGVYDKVTLLNENTLLLTDRCGERLYVNLEEHVNNIIMDYVFKM